MIFEVLLITVSTCLAFSSPEVPKSVPAVNSCDNMNSKSLRSVLKVIPQQPQHWVGDGFHVYPVFGHYAFTETVSPWLMFDYAAPKKFNPTKRQLGVGQHPHRGFETITIAFEGEVEHADSVGNRGVIGPGDIQWMTAGRGIIHEEFHSTEFAKKGGNFEMCQLWLNLPAKDKMTPPRYQSILKKDIPSVDIKNEVNDKVIGSLKVIAGKFQEKVGPAKTFSPVALWDLTIDEKMVPISVKIPENYNVIVFTRRGSVIATGENEEKVIKPQSVAIMSQKGDHVSLTALEEKTQILIMAGEPFNEPIAARGPFVMNTQSQLRQAMVDYQTGVLGT